MRRTALARERREEIISAAIRVFQRDGFRGATLDDVAKEVGISKSLIYYHFKNKFEILAQMYRNMGELFFEVLNPILEDESLDHVVRLRLVIKAHVSIAIQNKSIFEIYFRERQEIPPAVQEKLVTHRDRIYVDKLARLIADGQALGTFDTDSPRLAAFSIIGACNWITFWYRADYNRPDRPNVGSEEVAEVIFQTVANGLVRRPSATNASLRADG